MKRTLRQALHFVQPLCSVDCFTFCMLVQLIFKTAGFVPDVIRSCSKALLATQRQTASIHQVTKELPARGHLITIQALCLGHSAQQQSYPAWKTNVTHTTVLKKKLKIKINQLLKMNRSQFFPNFSFTKSQILNLQKFIFYVGFFVRFFCFCLVLNATCTARDSFYWFIHLSLFVKNALLFIYCCLWKMFPTLLIFFKSQLQSDFVVAAVVVVVFCKQYSQMHNPCGI